MREEYGKPDKELPPFEKNYKLGDCNVHDCGCITEDRTKKNGNIMLWMCPDHTHKG